MEWRRIGAFAFGNNLVPLVLIALAAVAYLRYAPESMKPWSSKPTAPAAEASQPKPVVKIERIIVPGPERIQVIEKIEYVEKMPGALAPSTATDNASQVIASAEIPPHAGRAIATAILERGADNVGRGRIEVKDMPPKFVELKKEFGVRAGYGTGGLVLGEIYARPLRVGPVDVEVRGFGKRDDRSGADFGGVVLGDYRF